MPANWDGTPKTWAVGELVTAAEMNSELRDRMDWLKGAIANHYLRVEDQKTSGTQGGTFTQAAWQTRDLNTEVKDTGGYVTLASNQMTLAAGTYWAHIRCPAYAVNQNQARLRNVTDSATLLLGEVAYARLVSGGSHTIYAEVGGIFTIGATKALEVQHYGTTTSASNGFGVPLSIGTEVYTTVELIRIGD
jgi:hypothetical protein